MRARPEPCRRGIRPRKGRPTAGPRPALRCSCGCRNRRSPGGWPGRPDPAPAAPVCGLWILCLQAGSCRSSGLAGRSRNGFRPGRSSPSVRRSRPPPAELPSRCRPSPRAGRAARPPWAGAGSRAGSHGPIPTGNGLRRSPAGRSPGIRSDRERRPTRNAPGSSRRFAPNHP